jgi:hypothetical protein
MKNFPEIGLQIPDILLPASNIDLEKWSVIACDQFTSQPDYWNQVAAFVGKAPSTFHITLPEIYLGKPEETERLNSTHALMKEYLHNRILEPFEGMIYVERSVDGKTRRGLMIALDLEKYDFSKGSQSLIRATEGTILDRLPPRIKIREKSCLELPHILVLIDDPQDTVIGPIQKAAHNLPIAYDFNLMQSSGHLTGRKVINLELESHVITALGHLAQKESFFQKYHVSPDHGVLLFAVGDGNHSLATAKSIWEKLKPQVGMDHPARYALIELENIHDKGLEFAPIHRVLFGVKSDLEKAFRDYFGSSISFETVKSKHEMIEKVKRPSEKGHKFGFISSGRFQVIAVSSPQSNLPVGTLQAFLDAWLKTGQAGSIDYVHGDEVVCDLGSQDHNCGFYLPPMGKDQLFKTVILDGALPRKTFSMGEAHEKRFYLEARKIVK